MAKKMNAIEKMVAELCPEGVEFKALGAITTVSGAGVDKKIKNNEKPIKLLNYMDVYRNRYINKTIPTMEVTTNDNKIEQCNVLTGDIFITPSSEVLNDIGSSAVAIEDMGGVVYSYHIMRLRLQEPKLITSMFISYMLGSDYVQNQINRKAKGITRFGLTKTQWEKITIPIPPLAIQQEIVKILDTFTALETQLETEIEGELKARKKQYEYYRDELLDVGDDVEWKTLGEVGEFVRGKRFVKKDITSEGVPCIHYGEMYTHYKIWARETKSYLEPTLAAKLRVARPGDVVIVAAGETVEDIGSGVAWLGESNVVIHDACFTFTHNLNPKYVSYYLQTELFRSQIKRYISSAKISSINAAGLSKANIPIPPLAAQERIVTILDKFDALVNDISVGLPAELNARRKQYEYYRGKLLTFEPLEENHAKQ